MFNLEKAVRRWREDLQYRSSLSPRELDEFEDHLRARMDLEQELNPERTRAQAFAAADQEMGDPQALSSEFAKAGRPRWKGLLVAGWALFAASFMMPTLLSMLGRWKMHGRRWLGLMVGATGLNLLMWMPMFLYRLDAGYYVWVASFACVTVALWLREREWSAARVEKAAA